MKANERPKYAPQQRGGGPMGHGVGTGEKAASFGPSLRRLLGHLRPEIGIVYAVIAMVILGTIANAVGPAILGRATDIIFNGVVRDGSGIDFTALGNVLLLALASTWWPACSPGAPAS